MSSISDDEWQNMSAEERMKFQMDNCIFCKIIKGDVPSKKVYDDADFVGILDVKPGSKGHVLVLPKKHVQIMPQLGTELSGKLGVVVKTISNKLISSLGVKGVSVFVANGAVAGQNAPHLMLHILPRKEDDNVNLNPELKKINKNDIVNLRNRVISSLGLPEPGKEEKGPVKKETPKQISENVDVSKQEKVKEDEKPDKALLDKISNMFK